MTFKLFNALNEVFKEHKEVHLRDYEPTDGLEDYGTIGRYDEDSDIEEINLDMKTYPYAKLYVFDGDYEKSCKQQIELIKEQEKERNKLKSTNELYNMKFDI